MDNQISKTEFLKRYPKPKKCHLSIEEWTDSLGYCWAYAVTVDMGKVWDEDKYCPCEVFRKKNV